MLACSGLIAGLSSFSSLTSLLGDGFDRVQFLFVARAQVFFILLTAATWLVWQHSAHKRVAEAGRQGLTITPGWAVGWWFIPLANLAKVPAAMQELWKSSDPRSGPEEWKSTVSSGLISAWFGIYIAGNFLSNISARVESARSLLGLSLISDALLVGAAILAINLVRKIEWRLSNLGR